MKYSTADHLPIERPGPAGPAGREMHRHHTMRYYAHRVHESLTTRVWKLICAIFLGLLLIVGVITFMLWLSLRPHRPRIHIHDFSVPALGREGGFEDARITFSASARNSNLNIGIRYDSVDAALYYRDQRIGAEPAVSEAFYQEPKSTRVLNGFFSGATLTVSSKRWEEFMNDRKKGTVVFRLEFTATIRFRVSSWESKRHHMHANCDVDVGPDGLILALAKNRRCPVYFS